MVLASQKISFQDIDTRVRINPETYLKFEGNEMVTLQNILSDQSVRIQYDIMLILYPMANNWITVGELCEGWPEEDQAKIKSHLQMLYESKIVVTSESEVQEKPQSNLPANLGSGITINVENHHAMLRDSIRMASYRRAIEKSVKPDSIVMDLGSGSGILSFFAAKAGAKQIYAVEKRPDMVMLAKELAKENDLEDQIRFIENSSHLIKAEEIEPKPDLLISEILGNAILEENVLEFTLDARDRLLAPGATLIPYGLDIMLVAFDSGHVVDRSLEVDALGETYGFNFEILKTVLTQKSTLKLERFNPNLYTMMSEPVCVISLDFYKLKSHLFKQEFEFAAKQDGHISGFCAYFKARMDEETMLTNSPWAPPTHWTQMVYYFPTRRSVVSGETIAMEMVYDGGMNLWYKDWSF